MSSYIDSLTSWWPPKNIASEMGVPGYAQDSQVNTFLLAFWIPGSAADLALVWKNALTYFTKDSGFGSSNSEIQQNIAK